MGKCISDDVLSYMAAANVLEIFRSIEEGKTKFSDIMFKLSLNPGVLNRLLKVAIELGLLIKSDGYMFTEKGIKAYDLAVQLKALN